MKNLARIFASGVLLSLLLFVVIAPALACNKGSTHSFIITADEAVMPNVTLIPSAETVYIEITQTYGFTYISTPAERELKPRCKGPPYY